MFKHKPTHLWSGHQATSGYSSIWVIKRAMLFAEKEEEAASRSGIKVALGSAPTICIGRKRLYQGPVSSRTGWRMCFNLYVLKSKNPCSLFVPPLKVWRGKNSLEGASPLRLGLLEAKGPLPRADTGACAGSMSGSGT